MTLTEESSGLWRLDTGGTLIGYDGEHNVCSIRIELANVIGTWTWYLDIAYFDGTVATVPLEQVKDTISALLSRSYMREGLTVVQVRGVSAGSAVKKSSVARVRFGSSVNATEQMDAPSPSQWDIYSAQVAGYRDEAAASAAAAALAATQMPHINSGGTWSVWSTSAGGFVDSGVSAAGITPDIQIGSVTTLPAGSAATASMSGTAAEPLLNLGIPKGDKGDPGSGGGIGALYMRVDNGVIQYSADGVSWSDLITTAELTGPAGSQGEQGPPGSDGVSPTVIVTQTATGAVITATDAGGTTSATVFNGQDGSPGAAGSPGADGHTPEITASKSGKVTTIMADGTAIAEIDDGADGAPGSAGDDGITPDIQIGTVTTLPAGSEATASMTGTAAAPLLNLGIPKGDKGDPGGASAAGLSLGLTSATVGQTIKVKAVDTDGKPTEWEAVNLPSGGGEAWEKVAEITLTEQVNSVRGTFSACSAVYVQLQWGGVESDVGSIYIAPNCNDTFYTGESRAAATKITTSTTAKRGYTFIKIDTRVGSNWTATSSTLLRGDGSFGAITPDEPMNCDIGVSNNFGISMMKPYYFAIRDEPLSNGVHSITAYGAGMAIGTTLKVWGIKK